MKLFSKINLLIYLNNIKQLTKHFEIYFKNDKVCHFNINNLTGGNLGKQIATFKSQFNN